MQHNNERWQELARLESLAERYRCTDAGVPQWLCGVLQDAVEWHRKWLVRTERLGMDGQPARQPVPESLEGP